MAPPHASSCLRSLLHGPSTPQFVRHSGLGDLAPGDGSNFGSDLIFDLHGTTPSFRRCNNRVYFYQNDSRKQRVKRVSDIMSDDIVLHSGGSCSISDDVLKMYKAWTDLIMSGHVKLEGKFNCFKKAVRHTTNAIRIKADRMCPVYFQSTQGLKGKVIWRGTTGGPHGRTLRFVNIERRGGLLPVDELNHTVIYAGGDAHISLQALRIDESSSEGDDAGATVVLHRKFDETEAQYQYGFGSGISVEFVDGCYIIGAEEAENCSESSESDLEDADSNSGSKSQVQESRNGGGESWFYDCQGAEWNREPGQHPIFEMITKGDFTRIPDPKRKARNVTKLLRAIQAGIKALARLGQQNPNLSSLLRVADGGRLAMDDIAMAAIDYPSIAQLLKNNKHFTLDDSVGTIEVDKPFKTGDWLIGRIDRLDNGGYYHTEKDEFLLVKTIRGVSHVAIADECVPDQDPIGQYIV